MFVKKRNSEPVMKMPTLKISKPEQFLHESRTWNRMLDFFKQENSYLKTRLSEVLDQGVDKDFLALAEQFQNKFIIKDDMIDELRHDINEQQLNLIKKEKGELDTKLAGKQEKLRTEVESFEKYFMNLKNEFNNYLSSVL